MKIGVISDTHGFLDPKILKLFTGVGHILHAGDIGDPFIPFELEQIAPVTVVVGNNDPDLSFKETEAVELASRKFLIPTSSDRMRQRKNWKCESSANDRTWLCSAIRTNDLLKRWVEFYFSIRLFR